MRPPGGVPKAGGQAAEVDSTDTRTAVHFAHMERSCTFGRFRFASASAATGGSGSGS